MEAAEFTPRLLAQSASDLYQSEQSAGIAAACFIGSLYMLGMIYYLSTRFLNHIIEDLVCLADLKGEFTMPPLVYCSLNSLPTLILCFLSMFVSHTDLGVSAVIGSDFFNYGFLYYMILMQVVLKKQQAGNEPRRLDSWFYVRDSIFYLLSLVLFTAWIFVSNVNWWMALLSFLWAILFFVIQLKDSDVREVLFRWLGITDEDDSFNAEEQLNQRRFAEDIDDLVQKKFVDRNDDLLKKRIARNEGMLIINNGVDNRRTHLMIKWHRAVFTIMFALRQKHKSEKLERSRYYANLWRSKEEHEEVIEEDEAEENDQKDVKSPGLANQGDEVALLSHQKKRNADNDANDANQDGEGRNNHLEQKSDDNSKNNKNNENGDDAGQAPDEEDEEVVDVSIRCPETLSDKILYVIFFPVHVLIYALPNYHDQPSVKKLVVCLLLNLLLIGFALFLIDWWLGTFARTFDIPAAIIGTILLGVCLQVPFYKYNLSFMRKDSESVEFLHSFVQLGIFKMGFCIGLPWLFNCLVYLKSNVTWQSNSNLQYLGVISGACYLLMFIFQIYNKFQINKYFANLILFAWFVFVVAVLVVLGIAKDKN